MPHTALLMKTMGRNIVGPQGDVTRRGAGVRRPDHLVITPVYLLKCGSSASEYEKYVSHLKNQMKPKCDGNGASLCVGRCLN